MNKVPKTDYKGQTAVLLSIFVLVGMMFVVPAITEKALAGVNAVATLNCRTTMRCGMTVVGSSLQSGKWVEHPTVSGDTVRWKTTGNPPGGNENGIVDVQGSNAVAGKLRLTFNNPWFGKNSCSVLFLSVGNFVGRCEAGSGYNADFTWGIEIAKSKTESITASL